MPRLKRGNMTKLKGIVIGLLSILSVSSVKGQDNFKVPFDNFYLNIDGRVEYQNSSIKSGGSTQKSMGFYTRNLILQTDFEIYKGLSAFYRQEFAGYINGGDGLANHINMLGLRYKYNNWTFVAGKQALVNGAYECFYLPGDVYEYSDMNNGFPVWQTGLTVAHHFGKQEFGVQMVNGLDGSPNLMSASNRLYYNFYWCGNLMDGKILTRFNFGSHYEKGVSRYTTELGLHWTLGRLIMDSDIGYVHGLTGLLPKEVSIMSAPLQCQYSFTHIRPGFKYIPSYVKNDTNESFRFMSAKNEGFRQQLLLFVDYFPWEKKNFHLFCLGSILADGEYAGPILSSNNEALFRFRAGIKFGFDLFSKVH